MLAGGKFPLRKMKKTLDSLLTAKINHGMLSKVLCEQVSRLRRADCVEVRLIENAGMHYFLSLKKNHQDVWY